MIDSPQILQFRHPSTRTVEPAVFVPDPISPSGQAEASTRGVPQNRRILLVFCSLELGGAERQGLLLARYLQKVGCDVRVWSTLAGHGLVVEHCDAADIPWSVHRFRWPCRKSSLVRDGLRFLRALWRERPDVVLSYTTCPNVACGLFWRWSPVKACIWGQRNVHELRGDAVERAAYRRVSMVICNASHEVDFLRDVLGETPAPVTVIHNGLDLGTAEQDRFGWRCRLGISADDLVVTMLANLRPAKDHVTLLHAWHRLIRELPEKAPGLHLLLAGAPQQSAASVRELAASLRILDTSVHLLGQVTDVSGLLAASDVGVLTSAREGLPNAVLEYMAAGLPVIATDLPGNREALGMDYDHPFPAVADPAQVAEAIGLLLADSSLRRKLGERNRERAATEFSIKVMCEKTVSCIDEALGR